MIHYSLTCETNHKFDAWFASAAAFEAQAKRGIVTCPVCDTTKVTKDIMAPAVSRAGSDKMAVSIGHPQHAELRAAMKLLREKMVSESDYVGDKFAEEARKIHFKEVEGRSIYGEASREEVEAMIEDGIDFMPLPGIPEGQN